MSQQIQTVALAALQERIEAIAAELAGTLGTCIRFLDDGLSLRFNADDVFPAASMIKVPIMVEAYRQAQEGRISLDHPVSVRGEGVVGGSGLLQYLHHGLELTLRDAIELMIIVSDNTATNLVLDVVGYENVNRTMAGLGLGNTWSGGYVGRGAKRLSQTTPEEMAELLTRIAQRQFVSPAGCEAMLVTLERQVYDGGLPRHLPFTEYPEKLGLAVSPVRVAHKTGSLSGVRHDAGVLRCETDAGPRTVVVSVFTKDLQDGELWTPDNIGLRAIAAIGRLAYQTQLALL